MSLQFSAGGEGEKEEEGELAVLAAAAAAQQWEESLEHLKQELSQCDEETKVRKGGRRRRREDVITVKVRRAKAEEGRATKQGVGSAPTE